MPCARGTQAGQNPESKVLTVYCDANTLAEGYDRVVRESHRQTPTPSLRGEHKSPELPGAYLGARFLRNEGTGSVFKYRTLCGYISRSESSYTLGLSHPLRSSHLHSIDWLPFQGRGPLSTLLSVFLYLYYYMPFSSSQHGHSGSDALLRLSVHQTCPGVQDTGYKE